MAKYKIELDRNTCIGCGACTVACDNFVTDGDKAKVVNSEVDSIGCNKEAADGCPVGAIKITKIE
ncbi:MAG: ferredoxin [Candidatus Woesearchaeota archaeon]|nr:MAG: ferredoxin [Candidatus Woesearchaeota archaeon]